MGLSFALPVDMGLNLSYFAGLGDLSSFSYLYIAPWLGKSFSFGDHLGMDLSLGFGFKVFTDEATRDAGDNVVDINFGASFPISLPDGFYVAPAINAAWTNFETNGAGMNATVGDEYMIYGSLSVGADF